MSDLLLAAGCLAGVACAFAAGTLLARLLDYRRAMGSPADSEPAALARFEAMGELLSQNDYAFLERQPGFESSIGVKFRRQRRRIFRLYLRELAADFHAVHATARSMVANSDAADPDIISNLVRLQGQFWKAMILIEFQLFLEALGWKKPDPQKLLGLVRDLSAIADPGTPPPGPVLV